MACNNCTSVCSVQFCYNTLWLFKATANTSYLVKFTNIGSGRSNSEQVTSDSEGFVKLTAGAWNEFFNTDSEVKFQLFEMIGSTYTNIPVDFKVITGFSGGSYASQQATVSTTDYDCVYVNFTHLFDEDGVIELDNQYFFNTNA